MRTPEHEVPDMADVPDVQAVQAVVQAVAGGHNILITANPGVGPTMIARRIAGILAPLTDHERTWLDAEYDGAGRLSAGGAGRQGRPLRAPHHTVSEAGLVGTSTVRGSRGLRLGRAGEVQLARFGVLYLDELAEFRLAAIDRLAAVLSTMAGAPLVVASVAPCPCGWRGSDRRACTCSDPLVVRYGARVEHYATVLQLEARITMAERPRRCELRGHTPAR